MKIDPRKEGIVAINSTGVGTVTPEMVEARAVELALINGRAADEVSALDREQAERELTGGPEMDPTEAALEALPESERWDPVPGSTGRVVPVTAEDGEDEDGRSIGEKLIEEGVQEAEHDQMLKAARKGVREDQE